MNIEQLKLVLEAVQGVSQGAFIFALLWLLKGFMGTLLVFTAVIFIVKTIAGLISKGIKEGAFYDALMLEIRDAGHDGYITDAQRHALILEWVKKGRAGYEPPKKELPKAPEGKSGVMNCSDESDTGFR